MSPPLTPHWTQPSHPQIQRVITTPTSDPNSFSTKSISLVTLPPFALFAKLSFPPCTTASEPTYATVQTGKDTHLNLNSDLLYINHSCDPSLIFDMQNLEILAGPKGLTAGQELTFFYPSTEWSMAQPFSCNCNTPQCRGTISGAKDMTSSQLEGLWLNGHIRELLQEREKKIAAKLNGVNGYHKTEEDATTIALKNALSQAEKMVEAARLALTTYEGGKERQRRGPTSRELSGEMGGDTIVI
ncbi:hypothetical protein QBC38DRAFT_171095 [Podospora fimiseda]|uniref:Post-SET domain-containing protein n=1 Tax=Podospora fimiseda TaxID=252190 RepID=A0AAN7BR72_9PEZI|nr:hypothetical protein QBC38DRAFT_171095 [Podospora fimiseda]